MKLSSRDIPLELLDDMSHKDMLLDSLRMACEEYKAMYDDYDEFAKDMGIADEPGEELRQFLFRTYKLLEWAEQHISEEETTGTLQ